MNPINGRNFVFTFKGALLTLFLHFPMAFLTQYPFNHTDSLIFVSINRIHLKFSDFPTCPLILCTLCILQFLGLQSTLDKKGGQFREAHKILTSVMSLILEIDQYLTVIWPSQCWVSYSKINILTL